MMLTLSSLENSSIYSHVKIKHLEIYELLKDNSKKTTRSLTVV